MPYDDNSGYDLLAYMNDKFYKVQIKTTEKVINNICMRFSLSRTNPYKKTSEKYDKNEVDLFALYCVENDWCGIIDYNEHSKEISFWLEKSSNCIHMAEDYEFHKQIYSISNIDTIQNTIDHSKDHKRRESESKKDICPICNKNMERDRAKMCIECYRKSIHKNTYQDDVDKDELLQLILTTPFTQIGKKYGVSDNAIRKWCKKLDLPYNKEQIKKYKESNNI